MVTKKIQLPVWVCWNCSASIRCTSKGRKFEGSLCLFSLKQCTSHSSVQSIIWKWKKSHFYKPSRTWPSTWKDNTNQEGRYRKSSFGWAAEILGSGWRISLGLHKSGLHGRAGNKPNPVRMSCVGNPATVRMNEPKPELSNLHPSHSLWPNTNTPHPWTHRPPFFYL